MLILFVSTVVLTIVRPLAQGIFVYVLDMTQHINRRNRWKSVFAGELRCGN